MRFGLPALMGAVIAASTSARADELEACNGALVRGQELTKAGKLIEARAAYPACLRESCDPAIRAVCSNFIAKLTTAIPTLSIEASASGVRITNASFFVDGVRVVDAAHPVEVDPGERRVRAEAPGYSPREERVVATEGQALRRVELGLVPIASLPPSGRASGAPRGLPVSVAILGGVSLLMAGSFVAFGLAGKSTERDLRASCPAGPCDSSTMRRQYLMADVSAVVALLAGGGATWIALSHGSER